jgi:putative N6-adenine-specific DNA methylase
MSPAPALTCFAVCAVGLEPLLVGELRALSAERRIEVGAVQPGGVEFRADRSGLYLANLHLRTASRVLVRIGSFHASAFHELERRARRVPWETLVSPGSTVEFRVSARKSRLYHQDAIAQRLLAAVAERVPGTHAASPLSADREDAPSAAALRVGVRFFRDECTLSADSSGELLHRRGYRLATAKAPLRETLAAAMLLASGWDGSTPLMDPMCGSGTIPIEGALIARRIPPGVRRRFAFEEWPTFDPDLWLRVREAAAGRILSAAPAPILGSDRDQGAILAALANAERAGVDGDVDLRRAAVSAIEPPRHAGWLVTNPPYGIRVGERKRLRNLYAQLGNVARRRCLGWRIAFLSTHPELEGQTGIQLERLFGTFNGGIRVSLVQGMVPGTPVAPV